MSRNKEKDGNVSDLLRPHDLQDLDDILKLTNEKKKEGTRLRAQLEQLRKESSILLEALQCSDKAEFDKVIHTLPSNSFSTENVSSHELERRKKAVYFQEMFTVHRHFGTEILCVDENKYIVKVGCNGENHPDLPEAIITIEKLPNVDLYRMKPKEITFYLKCSEETRLLMNRSSRENIIKAFRQMQLLILDLFKRDAVYQKLLLEPVIRSSLSCSICRSFISFILPVARRALILQEGRVKQSSTGNSSCKSFLEGHVSILLNRNLQTRTGWVANIYKHESNFQNVSPMFEKALLDFLQDVAHEGVVASVQTLLHKVTPYTECTELQDLSAASDMDTEPFEAFY